MPQKHFTCRQPPKYAKWHLSCLSGCGCAPTPPQLQPALSPPLANGAYESSATKSTHANLYGQAVSMLRLVSFTPLLTMLPCSAPFFLKLNEASEEQSKQTEKYCRHLFFWGEWVAFLSPHVACNQAVRRCGKHFVAGTGNPSKLSIFIS